MEEVDFNSRHCLQRSTLEPRECCCHNFSDMQYDQVGSAENQPAHARLWGQVLLTTLLTSLKLGCISLLIDAGGFLCPRREIHDILQPEENG